MPPDLDAQRQSLTDVISAADASLKAGRLQQADIDLSRILKLPHATRDEVIKALLLRGSVRMAAQEPALAVQDWNVVLRLEPYHEGALAFLDGAFSNNHEVVVPTSPGLSSNTDSPPPSPLFSRSDRDSTSRYSRSIPSAARLSGKIAVKRRDTGEFLGYITLHPSGHCTLDRDSAFTISANPIPPPFEMIIENHPDDQYPCLGWAAPDSFALGRLMPGSDAYAVLTRTEHTAPNDPPTIARHHPASSDGGQPVESAVWNYAAESQRLTAHWVNDDRSKYPNEICFIPDLPALYLVGDVAGCKALFPRSFVVDLTVVR